MSLGVHPFARPHAGRASAAANHHPRRFSRQEPPFMRVAVEFGVSPGHSLLDAPPVFAPIIGPEETARGGNVVAFLAAGIVVYVVHVDISDPFASVVPGLTPIRAEEDATMFEQHE